MAIIVETHRVMGVDVAELPDATPLLAHAYDDGDGDVWTAVIVPPAEDERGAGECVGTTIPGGRIEIYASDSDGLRDLT